MSADNRNRIAWVDAARGFGIVLVVFGHVWDGIVRANIAPSTEVFLVAHRAIYLFHMPLFFLLSGVFFARTATGTFAKQLRRRVISLLYPLLLWAYVFAFFRFVAGDASNAGHMSLAEVLTYPFPPKDGFWFLWTLFLVQTACAVMALWPRGFPTTLIISSILCIVWISLPGPLPWWEERVIEQLPYFAAGVLFAHFGQRGVGSRTVAAISVLAFLTVQMAVALQPADLSWVEIPGWLYVAGALTCSFAVVFVVGCVRDYTNFPGRVVTTLGEASIGIYVAHVIFAAGWRALLLRLGVDDPMFHLISGTVVGVVFPLVMFEMAGRLGLRRLLGLGRDLAPASSYSSEVDGDGPEKRVGTHLV